MATLEEQPAAVTVAGKGSRFLTADASTRTWHLVGAVAALKALAVEVLNNEPDTLMYLVHTPDMTQASLPPPTGAQILFVEAYASMDAFYAHLTGLAFTSFVKQYGDLFIVATGTTADGQTASIPFVEVEFLDRQAGFVRESASGS